jgi:hypothetical protein
MHKEKEIQKIEVLTTNNDDKINILAKSKWNDPYLLELALADHLIECRFNYEKYKYTSCHDDKREYYKKQFIKELCDLKILLDIKAKNEISFSENIKERIEKFMDKLKL